MSNYFSFFFYGYNIRQDKTFSSCSFLLHIFACGFTLRPAQKKRKREGVVTSLMCCFIKYPFVCLLAFVFVEKSTHMRKEVWRGEIHQKIRKNERKKKREDDETRFSVVEIKNHYLDSSFLLSFFFFHHHIYSFIHLCLRLLQRYFAPITWTLTLMIKAQLIYAFVLIE